MVPDTLSVPTGPPVHPAAMSDGTWRVTTDAPENQPVAMEPSSVVSGIEPDGQTVEPFQLMTADKAAFVGDDEEHVKGLEANVPVSCGVPKPSTTPELDVQFDNEASMADSAPPPDPVSGGVNPTVPDKEHVAASVDAPREIVPDTGAELRPLRAHALWSFEGTCNCSSAAPANEPLAIPETIWVGFILLIGRASPTQWIVPDKTAPVCDEDEQLKGLELNEPRREAEMILSTVVDANVQLDSFPETRECVPPPEVVRGGAKCRTPVNVQLTEPPTVCFRAAEAACDVAVSTATTTIAANNVCRIRRARTGARRRTIPMSPPPAWTRSPSQTPRRARALGRSVTQSLRPSQSVLRRGTGDAVHMVAHQGRGPGWGGVDGDDPDWIDAAVQWAGSAGAMLALRWNTLSGS